jgi:diadenylate cyclase
LGGVIQYLLGPGVRWGDLVLAAVDVGVVAALVFKVLALIRGTRALQMLIGILLLGAGYLAAGWVGFETLHWLLGHLLSYGLLFGFIVLFQADIRRALAQLGRSSLLEPFTRMHRAAQAEAVDAVVTAASTLARKRQGALIVIERAGDLTEIVEGGLRLDARVSAELLQSIFYTGTPTHDGAVIIRGEKVIAARCVLPLAGVAAAAELGTRHRAAVGLAEEVDAAVVVVSEERGEISLAVAGTLRRGLDGEKLRRFLLQLTAPGRTPDVRKVVTTGVRSLLSSPPVQGKRSFSSDLPLALAALITALGCFLSVRGDRVFAYRVAVPIERHLPGDLEAASKLPEQLAVTLVGPWDRLRDVSPLQLGPLSLEVTARRAGPSTWFIRTDELRLPPGIRLQGTEAVSGPVEIIRTTPENARR